MATALELAAELAVCGLLGRQQREPGVESGEVRGGHLEIKLCGGSRCRPCVGSLPWQAAFSLQGILRSLKLQVEFWGGSVILQFSVAAQRDLCKPAVCQVHLRHSSPALKPCEPRCEWVCGRWVGRALRSCAGDESDVDRSLAVEVVATLSPHRFLGSWPPGHGVEPNEFGAAVGLPGG